MRKLSVLLVVMVLGFSISAVGGVNKSDAKDDLTVTLNLGTGDNAQTYYEVGFATAEVDESSIFGDSGLSNPSTKDGVALKLQNSTLANNLEDEVWVYWNIIDATGVTINLNIITPLQNTAVEDVIQWKVSWDEKSITSSDIKDTAVTAVPISDTPLKGIGSKQLTIETVSSLAGITPAEYIGTLQVNVSTN